MISEKKKLELSTIKTNLAFKNMLANLRKLSAQLDKSIETSEKILRNIKVITK